MKSIRKMASSELAQERCGFEMKRESRLSGLIWPERKKATRPGITGARFNMPMNFMSKTVHAGEAYGAPSIFPGHY